jgi:hypothetical protein
LRNCLLLLLLERGAETERSGRVGRSVGGTLKKKNALLHV